MNMDNNPSRSLVSATAGTYDIVHKVKLAQLVCTLAMGLAGLLLLIGVLARLFLPGEGGRAATAVSVVAGMLSFGASLVVVQVLAPKPGGSGDLGAAVRAYVRPCMLAVGANAVGLLVTDLVIFSVGFGKGAWVPLLAMAGLNIFGAALTWPRVKTLRKLHPVQSLPYAR